MLISNKRLAEFTGFQGNATGFDAEIATENQAQGSARRAKLAAIGFKLEAISARSIFQSQSFVKGPRPRHVQARAPNVNFVLPDDRLDRTNLPGLLGRSGEHVAAIRVIE